MQQARRFQVAHARHAVKFVEARFQPGPQIAAVMLIQRDADNLEPAAIMMLDQGDKLGRHHMRPEIGGNIGDANFVTRRCGPLPERRRHMRNPLAQRLARAVQQQSRIVAVAQQVYGRNDIVHLADTRPQFRADVADTRPVTQGKSAARQGPEGKAMRPVRFQRHLIIRRCLDGTLQATENIAAIVEKLGMAGRQLQPRIEGRQRLVQAVHLHEGDAAVVERGDMGWIGGQHRIETGQSVAIALQLPERHATIGERFNIPGLARQQSRERRQGLLGAAFLQQRQANPAARQIAAAQRLGMAGTRRQRRLEIAQGFLSPRQIVQQQMGAIDQHLNVAGTPRHAGVVIYQRLLEPAQRAIEIAPVVEGDQIIGIQAQALIVTGQRLIQPLQLAQDGTAVTPGGGVARIGLQAAVVTGQRFLKPFQFAQHRAAMTPGRGAARITRQNLIIDRHRVRPALLGLQQGGADHQTRIEIVRLVQRRIDGAQSFISAALARQYQAQQMPGGMRLGRLLQDFTAGLLGFGQPSPLPEGIGLRDHRLQIHGMENYVILLRLACKQP